MKVTYLYHSGFAVELEKHIFVFDYMKGKLPDWDGRKEIIFFASHKHPDHFVMDSGLGSMKISAMSLVPISN